MRGVVRMSDELPFDTAPEIVPELCADLNLSPDSLEQARELSERYGGVDADRPLNRSPSAIASAAVWMTAEEHPTQSEVVEHVECSVVALRNAKRLMREDIEVPQ